jgi:quercetin dioxygenase-like cupin family protein
MARLMVAFLVLGVALSAGAQTVPVDLKDIAVPAGAYWATQEVVIGRGQSVAHRHGLEFVFALKGDAAVRIGSAAVTIPEGKAYGIPAGVAHAHLTAGQGESRIVASQLAGEAATWGTLEILRTKRTTALAGFRQGPQMARLSEVVLAPFAQTPVHTHPGPEAVYILEGPIVLQTEGKLVMLLRGDLAVLPGDTALQARYIGGVGQGRFLALFVVAEGAPFSSPIPAGFKAAPQP